VIDGMASLRIGLDCRGKIGDLLVGYFGLGIALENGTSNKITLIKELAFI
jgi:hypothetical protein